MLCTPPPACQGLPGWLAPISWRLKFGSGPLLTLNPELTLGEVVSPGPEEGEGRITFLQQRLCWSTCSAPAGLCPRRSSWLVGSLVRHFSSFCHTNHNGGSFPGEGV